MPTGICHLSCIPLRAEPSSKAEMISQLLLGETYDILEETNDWAYIKLDWDRYEGWINRGQLYIPKEILPTRLITTSPVSYAIGTQNHIISLGSELSVSANGVVCFRHLAEEVQLSAQSPDKDPIRLARSMLGAPYLWGGRTFMGIDCSGLVQVVAKAMQKAIHRDAKDQANLGETVAFIQESKPGDLAFFDNAEGTITHVGMLLGHDEIIHASGMVRIDRFDTQGIFNADSGKHTHKLRIIKRVF